MKGRFRKTDLLIAALGIVGLAVFLEFHEKAFPTASIDLQVTGSQALKISREYLETQKFDLGGYTETAVFSEDSEGMVYLQRTLGMTEFNRIAGELPLRYWQVRFFKELQYEEFRVWINPRGQVIAFIHYLPEDAEGDNLKQAEALDLAEAFIHELREIDLARYTLSDTATKKRENRTDHTFTWEAKDRDFGEARLILSVGIHGSVIDLFDQSLNVPEKFLEDAHSESSKGDLLTSISGILSSLLTLLAIIVFLRAYKLLSIPWKGALLLAVTVGIAGFLEEINAFPILRSAYPTESPLYSFWGEAAVEIAESVLWLGIQTFLYAIAGWAVCREVFFKDRRTDSLPGYKSWFSPEVCHASFMGYLLAFIGLGYVTAFYLLGERYLGVWSPADSNYSNMLGTWIPFLDPLCGSFQAAVSEELQYRFFAIALLLRYLKVRVLALLIPAVIWGFAHSNYAVYPFYTRGIELTADGLLTGYFFIRYGLITVIVAHYVFNAIVIGMSLIQSSNPYFFWSGIAVVGLMAIPFLPGMISALAGRAVLWQRSPVKVLKLE